MRQHELGKGKSGRDIRRTLKQVREAREGTEADQAELLGTEIANRRAGTRELRSGYTDDTDDYSGGVGRGYGGPESTSRVMERLTDNRELADRLQALRARQQRLPLDLEMAVNEPATRTRAKETRDDLVERLLDPVLTLQETAILLDVCPTTVRRYTNRGVLNCFRTPGNQRRFRLSDIISFMERRDTAD